MDYREELLNRALIMLNDAGIENIEGIKIVLIKAIDGYEISARCTDVVVLEDVNTQIVKMFLATKLVEGGSQETAKTRAYIIRKFCNFINKPLKDVCSFDILRWLAKIQSEVSLGTAESYRNIIASLFNWMASTGVISNNPMATIKPIKHPNVLSKSFTPVEIDAMKTACSTSVERAMVELLLSSGLRCEELCNLKWSDIDFVTNDINVIEGKGDKNRVTMMDDVTKKYLLEYKKTINYTSDYIFAVKYRGEIKVRSTDSVWRKLKCIADKAGVDKVNPHKFRHTFATTLYKRGLDIRMIQKLLGHSNINTTMIYIDSDVEMLRDAYRKCI